MNEVTRIHLGRQPFTVSVDAHKALKAYLHDIEAKVSDQDVINEVELRMAELLQERGISGDKVILPADVEFLKTQLGNAEDFGDSEEPSTAATGEQTTKRLFRDTDNAILAGVAAGLAQYTGIDVVIIRILFVLLAFGSGIGILAYIVFWLLVPAANSASDKLQMRGKQVTLDALRESVSRADVSGATKRINSRVLSLINSAFKLCAMILGVGFILAGIGLFVSIAAVKMYMSLHHNQLFQEGIFPVGSREQLLLWLGLAIMAIIALFLVFIGIDAIRRKWPVHGWITGILAGILILCSVAAGVLAADAAPRINQRYEATLHTTAVKDIQPFHTVSVIGNTDVAYISSPTYAVNVHYSENPDLSKMKIYVQNDTLYIDSTELDKVNHCTMLCLFPGYNMTVQIYAPDTVRFNTPPTSEIFYPSAPGLN